MATVEASERALTTEVGFVPAHVLSLWWDAIAVLLEDALRYSAGETDLEHVRTRCEAGELFPLVAFRGTEVTAAFVCSVVDYDRFRAVRVVLAGGGELTEWLEPLVDKLETWARQIGAEQLELFGRPGFTRALRNIADHQYEVMVRKVTS